MLVIYPFATTNRHPTSVKGYLKLMIACLRVPIFSNNNVVGARKIKLSVPTGNIYVISQ